MRYQHSFGLTKTLSPARHSHRYARRSDHIWKNATRVLSKINSLSLHGATQKPILVVLVRRGVLRDPYRLLRATRAFNANVRDGGKQRLNSKQKINYHLPHTWLFVTPEILNIWKFTGTSTEQGDVSGFPLSKSHEFLVCKHIPTSSPTAICARTQAEGNSSHRLHRQCCTRNFNNKSPRSGTGIQQNCNSAPYACGSGVLKTIVP